MIVRFWEEEKNSFEQLWKCYGNLNLRFLDTFFQAFVETINNIKFEHISNTVYLKAVLYSIFTVHCLSYEAAINQSRLISTGGSILFYLKCYNISNNLEKAFEKFPGIRWVDINISGNWLLNQPVDNISNDIYERFTQYPFYELENELLNGHSNIIKEQRKCKIEHILYAGDKCTDAEQSSYLHCIDTCDWWPADCTDGQKVVCDMVNTVGQVRVGQSLDIWDAIYKKLYQRFGIDHLEGEEGQNMYNEVVEEIKRDRT